MERLELLDPNPDKPMGRLITDIASHNSNNAIWKLEKRVMHQDETTISIRGKITEMKQRLPNYRQGIAIAYHLQLKSKSPTQSGSFYLETFQCYHIGRAESILETLVSDNGC